MTNNSLSPHGGKIVERIMEPEKAWGDIQSLAAIPIGDQAASTRMTDNLLSPHGGKLIKRVIKPGKTGDKAVIQNFK